jgi:excisionase family DNA binding protein
MISKDIQTKEVISYSELAQKVFLSIEEVEIYTGLSKSYLYKLTSQKKIPHSKPHGKVIFFERLRLDEWLRRNQVEPIDIGLTEQKASEYLRSNPKGIR